MIVQHEGRRKQIDDQSFAAHDIGCSVKWTSRSRLLVGRPRLRAGRAEEKKQREEKWSLYSLGRLTDNLAGIVFTHTPPLLIRDVKTRL
jgi:hypothetical protein